MHLLDVRLQNITCFEDLYLDFRSRDSDEPAPWVVLLGENGTGKSTILQIIGSTLLGYKHRSVIAGDVDWGGYLRDLDRVPPELVGREVDADYDVFVGYADCWLTIKPEQGDANFDDFPNNYFTKYRFSRQASDEVHSGGGPKGLRQSLSEAGLTDGWFGCGYSPWRRLGKASSMNSSLAEFPTYENDAVPYRFASLFGDLAETTNVPQWLAGLYVRSIFPEHTKDDESRYRIAEQALRETISSSNPLTVTPQQQVFVEENGRKIPLERLSDGYRGTLAWIGDLIRRLFDAYPDSDNPLHERGVVLVDEIDLHLHPKWQRSIVGDIRKLFPNLQFIVTTHSPFIAQGLLPADKIIVLERSSRTGAVTAREDSGALESWSADQILSSYFGLKDGTRGDKTLKDEARYERLLDLEASGTLTDKTRAELDKLRTRLENIPIGETHDEESALRNIEEMTKRLRMRREALETQGTETVAVAEEPAE